jgi:hypothetical protein
MSEVKKKTSDPMDIKRIIKNYNEPFCANKFYNLHGIDQFLKGTSAKTHIKK